jgi:hypothetical protein
MSDDFQKGLDAILKNHSEAKAAQARKSDAETLAAEQRLQEYLRARESAVRPVFSYLSDYLERAGYKCDITVLEPNSRNSAGTAGITLTVHPTQYEHPELTISWDAFQKKAVFQTSGTNHSGDKHGSYDISNLNEDLVRTKVLLWLEQVFPGKLLK